MFPHQCLEEHLVHFVVWAPIIANNMVSDFLDELLVEVVVSSSVLDVWVGVADETLGVVNLHVGVISSQHVQGQQVDNCLLPGLRTRFIKILVCFRTVVFNTVHRAFMRHIPLSCDIWHRLHLQEDQIRHILSDNF